MPLPPQALPLPTAAPDLLPVRLASLGIQRQAVPFPTLGVGVGLEALLVLPLQTGDAEERQGVDIHADGEEAANTEVTT